MVRLRFLRAAEGQQHPELSAEPVGSEHHVRTRSTAEQRTQHRATDLCHETLADAFGAVTGDDVPDLVTENDGEPGRGLRDRQDARVDGNLPAGEREGVLLLRVIDHRELPVEVWTVHHPRDPLPDGLDRLHDRAAPLEATLGEDLLVGLRSELGLLLGRDQDQLRAPRVRGGRARDRREEAHDEGSPAHGAPLAGGPPRGNSLSAKGRFDGSPAAWVVGFGRGRGGGACSLERGTHAWGDLRTAARTACEPLAAY